MSDNSAPNCVATVYVGVNLHPYVDYFVAHSSDLRFVTTLILYWLFYKSILITYTTWKNEKA